MAPPSRRLVAGLVAARLTTISNATVYYGQVGRLVDGTTGHEPPTKSQHDLRVKPYVVLYPGAGGDGVDESLGNCDRGRDSAYAITAVAGDIDDLLALVDRIDGALHGWSPAVAGMGLEEVRRQPGYEPTQLIDEQQNPPRLYVPLRYVHTATT